MSRRDDSRLLIFGAMLAAFVIGIVFGALGLGLRPKTALAPAAPQPTPLPQPLATNPAPTTGPSSTAESTSGDGATATTTGGDGPADSIPANGSHDAPADYPVKGNTRSGIYHVPGGLAYERTNADIFFRSPEAAEAAGLRHSKA